MIRQAVTADLLPVLELYRSAREFMRENGNPTQWGTSYPSEELLAEDVRRGELYVCEEEERPYGVFVLSFGPEPTYKRIEQGRWKSDKPYGTIHRVAGDGTVKGVFLECVQFCRSKCGHLRIDTHADNRVMRRLIEAAGFERRGIICVRGGSPRIAYEWTKE